MSRKDLPKAPERPAFMTHPFAAGMPAMSDQMLGQIVTAVRAEHMQDIEAMRELTGLVKDKVGEFSARITQVEQLAAKGATQGGFSGGATGEGIGSRLLNAVSDDVTFAHLKNWNQGTCRADLQGMGIKAALTNEPYEGASSNGGTIPGRPDYGGIVVPAMPQPRLLNFLRTRTVTSDSVEFVQLSSSGDVGYQEGEGTEKPEIDFAGTKRRAHITTIAGHTTASKQVLSDHSNLSQIIDSVLRTKLLNKLCYEIINGQGGNGDELKIEGLLEQGYILGLPEATGLADRVGEAITRMSVKGFNPGLIVMHPTSWFKHIATAKTQTEKNYLFGSPASPLPPALWNLPVALEAGLEEDKALVLDLAYITVLDRERISVLLSNSHKDNFTKNLVTILGELRAGLEVLDDRAIMIVEPTSELTSGD